MPPRTSDGYGEERIVRRPRCTGWRRGKVAKEGIDLAGNVEDERGAPTGNLIVDRCAADGELGCIEILCGVRAIQNAR